jgi:hypothetical protein
MESGTSQSLLWCIHCGRYINDSQVSEHVHGDVTLFDAVLVDIEPKYKGGVDMGLKEYAMRKTKEEEDRRKERFAESGFEEFLKLPSGSSTLEMVDAEPRQSQSNFGSTTIYRVKYQPKGGNKKEYDWSINNKSFSLLRDLNALLAKGVTKVQITRMGKGADTRYEVAEA